MNQRHMGETVCSPLADSSLYLSQIHATRMTTNEKIFKSQIKTNFQLLIKLLLRHTNLIEKTARLFLACSVNILKLKAAFLLHILHDQAW